MSASRDQQGRFSARRSRTNQPEEGEDVLQSVEGRIQEVEDEEAGDAGEGEEASDAGEQGDQATGIPLNPNDHGPEGQLRGPGQPEEGRTNNTTAPAQRGDPYAPSRNVTAAPGQPGAGGTATDDGKIYVLGGTTYGKKPPDFDGHKRDHIEAENWIQKVEAHQFKNTQW